MAKYIWQQNDWPRFRWESAELIGPLAQCRKKQGKLIARTESLGLEMSRKAQADAMTREAVTTAEIEGVKLDTDTVRSSVARRLGLPDAGLPKTSRAIEGLVDILFDVAEKHNDTLDAERLFGWHAALFPTGYSGLKKIMTAQWRTSETPMRILSGPIGKEKVHFIAPDGADVATEMQNLFTWWRTSHGTMDGMIRAGVAHLYFVTIHPFEDGNGRQIGRAHV